LGSYVRSNDSPPIRGTLRTRSMRDDTSFHAGIQWVPYRVATSTPSVVSFTPFMAVRARPFFFSSRRRHTRFSRDWSSDVCSSDLIIHLIFELTIELQTELFLGK